MYKSSLETNHLELINKIKSIYGEGFIPLHRPVFDSREKSILCDVIDSNFVSSAGEQIAELEKLVASYVGSRFAVSVTSGTAAIHLSLIVAGVKAEEEVLTQSLTFVATGNAIMYTGAVPVFIDIDKKNLGMCPNALRNWLKTNTECRNGKVYNLSSGRIISACLPVHIFGMPCNMFELSKVCEEYNLTLIEDSAEALGSRIGKKYCGTFGKAGIFSFNGNKIITTGGGGMVVTDDEEFAKKAKHLSTTAKLSHRFEYFHDEVGYNYRMPNLNAALGLAQMEKLDKFINVKRYIYEEYAKFCNSFEISIMSEYSNKTSNFWLNAIILDSKQQRDNFISICASKDVMVRPVWHPLHKLPGFKHCESSQLPNTTYICDRVVNIPSSVPA